MMRTGKSRGKAAAAEKGEGEILGKVNSSSSSFLLAALKLCNNYNNKNNIKNKGFGGGPRCCCNTPVRAWMEVGGGAAIIKANPFLLLPHSFGFTSFSSTSQVSVRKLAAVFWEFYQLFSPLALTTNNNNIMYLGVNNHSHNHNHDHSNQRVRRHLRRGGDKDESFDQVHHHQQQQQQQQYHHPRLGFDPQSHATPDHHPASAGSLRRHIAASLMRHHQSAERNRHALQPLSPASYGSSLEMAPYNPAATPDSSVELRGRIGESSYSFKTSTELLKVLNRIWSLEEQHASNVSLVKGLKTELDHARIRIKELLRDQQANRHEIDQLMKKISEDSLGRKSKDHERIDAALQSARDELEDERRLRKRSESLHRKLARELFEVKVALATSVKEHEKDKKSSEVLEELCDEFAKGIRDCARQVQTAKQKSDRDWTGMTNRDNLILHMSESWLDERAQMKDREAQGITAQRQPVVDKLRHEIESFLAAQEQVDVKAKDPATPLDLHESRLRRRSLESIPEAVTGPQDSTFSDSQGPEASKLGPSNYDEQEELALRVRRKGQSPPSVQMSDRQNTPRQIDPRVMKTGEGTPTEINMLQKSDIYDSVKEQRRKAYGEEGHGSNSKAVDKLISELLQAEGGSLPPEYEHKEVASSNPASRRNASPIRQWMTSMASPDPRISEASSKTYPTKDNTLKARLQEPKLKGQRSRLKILKGSS